ncbi:MAG TPA: hypothetical protein VLJ57_15940 [Burkholderiaceae bacterium]|nr:hypothetical protein [Burkholderiaceae bacterium]
MQMDYLHFHDFWNIFSIQRSFLMKSGSNFQAVPRILLFMQARLPVRWVQSRNPSGLPPAGMLM